MTKRHYPEQPILATAMCIFCEGLILLIKRNKEPGKGKWTLPGGVVELGETVLEALKREIREELGIEAEPLGFLGIFERIKKDIKNQVEFHYVILDYYGIARDRDIRPSDEIADFIWIQPEKIQEFVDDPKAVEAILKASVEMKNLMRDEIT